MDENIIMLSIIVPVYNSEKTIEKCIKSILNIKDLSYEIIIVDDGSKDNSYMIAKKMLSGIEQAIVLKQKNQGPSVARNNGISKSKGKYIMFVDSDDWIEASEIKKITTAIKSNKYDTIMFNYNIVDKNGASKKYNRFKNIANIEDYKTLFKVLVTSYELNCIWNNLYNSKIIKSNNILFDKDTKNGEDFLFNINFFEKSNNNIFIDSKIYNHSIDSTGITNTFSMWKFDDVSKTYYERIRIVNQYLNCNPAIISTINSMYSKVIFRYIAFAKKNKIKNCEITKRMNDCNLNEIFKKNRKDILFEKIAKFLIRNKMYNLIKVLYIIHN